MSLCYEYECEHKQVNILVYLKATPCISWHERDLVMVLPKKRICSTDPGLLAATTSGSVQAIPL